MAVREDPYKIVTSVGPGTPMGNVFRRFWLPALLAEELEPRDGTPVRIRILGEDLIAFRDSAGKIGILSAYCTHRAAPLFFGRNEECGLRCVYHGWKFDVDGQCVDMPNVSAGERAGALKETAAIKSYPAIEAGGLVWVYMGPKDKQPDLPGMEWLKVPPSHVKTNRWLHKSNWLQGAEGEIDTSHISFLHNMQFAKKEARAAAAADASTAAPSALDRDYGVVLKIVEEDGAPEVTVKDTDYGFVYGARRRFGEQYYWRMTQWMLPNWSAIPGSVEDFLGGGRAWVPIDDHHTMAFSYKYRADKPLSEQELQDIASGAVFPPRGHWGTVRLPHGYTIDCYIPDASIENDFMIDRVSQATETYTGIWGINDQDRALQETMPGMDGQPGIVDRVHEHLVKSDAPVLAARRKLMKLAKDMEKGVEPEAPNRSESYFIRAWSVISPIADFGELLEVHGHLALPNTAPEQELVGS